MHASENKGIIAIVLIGASKAMSVLSPLSIGQLHIETSMDMRFLINTKGFGFLKVPFIKMKTGCTFWGFLKQEFSAACPSRLTCVVTVCQQYALR